jgi:protein TonB
MSRFFISRWSLLATIVLLVACGKKESQEPTTDTSNSASPANSLTPSPKQAGSDAARLDVASTPVSELLRRSRLAVSEQRLIAPAGDNALELYLAVLVKEPNNDQAIQAIVDIFPLVVGIAERSINQRQADEAERVIGLLDRASPKSYTVTALRNKLGVLKQQLLKEAAQQKSQQLDTALQQKQKIAAAQRPVIQPETKPSPIQSQIATASGSQAQKQTELPPSTSAKADDLPENRRVIPKPAEVDPASKPEVGLSKTSAPVGETKPARAIKQSAPQFPVQAMRRRVEGWVELEFTIDTNGSVTSVTVLRSQPKKVFDREAIKAIQKWKFEPALKNGEAVMSQGRRRLEFRL